MNVHFQASENKRDVSEEKYSLYGKLVLATGSANPGLAQEIADYLGVELLDRHVTQFANGNTFVRLNDSVRGSDVFWIQPTAAPTNDNLMELLIAIDTLKRDSAGRITAVVPYYGYGRSDKKDEPRVPITARLVADLLSVAGADRVLMMDLHAGQIQGFFSVPVDDITAGHMLAQYVLDKNIDKGVVVSPDLGSAKKARNFAIALDWPLALIEKRRTLDGQTTRVMNLIGEVEGRDVVIVDDEIDTAGTMCNAARFVVESGARRVYALATHGILSDPAMERLAEAPFEEVVVTNTVAVPPEKQIDKLKILSVGPLLGEVIYRIHLGESVGAMFNE